MDTLLRHGALAVGALCLVTSCIDDKYDLSDVDTTSHLQVNNLVVPVNLDKVQLSTIITLEDGGIIRDDNGEYAFVKEGDFHSSDITINKVVAHAPVLSPSHGDLVTVGSTDKEITMSFRLNPEPFEYVATNVDPSIYSLEAVEVDDITFGISLTAPELEGKASDIEFRNLEIQLPKGLTATCDLGTYDPATGILKVDVIKGNLKGTYLNVHATGIDFTSGEGKLDYATHTFRYSSALNVKSGDLVIGHIHVTSPIPEVTPFVASYTLTEMNIRSVTGEVEYNIEDMNIAPIDMSDIPDFLGQDGTNIFLASPRLFLGINNPVAPYKAHYQAGLTISAMRNGVVDASYSLDKGTFTVGSDKGNTMYNFCLTPPSNAETTYPGYDNAQPVAFTGLSDVVSGDGIPSQLKVEVDDPKLPLQRVEKLPLDVSLGQAKGKWTLYAPLAFKPTTTIIYADTETDWSDDDIDAITVTELEVTATVDTDLPVKATLSGFPLDINNQRMSGVEVEDVEVPANAKDYPITIHVKGEVRHLNGFEYRAVVQPANEESLKPTQSITLHNIRARVSGYYEKEL